MKTLYRYEKYCHAEELQDEGQGNNVTLKLVEFNVFKETPKGGWIFVGHKKRWVGYDTRKAYAYATKEQALDNFIRRTKVSTRWHNYYIKFNALAIEKALAEQVKLLVTDKL